MKVKSTPKNSARKQSAPDLSPAAEAAALPRPRHRFDEAFRQHAVALVSGGRRVAEVAEELGVSTFSLYGWCRQRRRQIDLQAPVPRTVCALEEEIARLREALQRSQLREEILKKSLGIFVAPPASPSPFSRP